MEDSKKSRDQLKGGGFYGWRDPGLGQKITRDSGLGQKITRDSGLATSTGSGFRRKNSPGFGICLKNLTGSGIDITNGIGILPDYFRDPGLNQMYAKLEEGLSKLCTPPQFNCISSLLRMVTFKVFSKPWWTI